MFMSNEKNLLNRLRTLRNTRGWSQQLLAEYTGLSRAEISAIETGRLVPSTSAAINLAAALDCHVEDIFFRAEESSLEHAWPSAREAHLVWRVRAGNEDLLYPFENTHIGTIAHDGNVKRGVFTPAGNTGISARTLLMAGCDPAAGILASELARAAGIRLIPLIRSSRDALALLRENKVHIAGVHSGTVQNSHTNRDSALALVGTGCCLVRVARWQEGLAVAPSMGLSSADAAVRAGLSWIGREEGSGARRCLDQLFQLVGSAPCTFEHIALDHRGVAESIRAGWAQAGVCVRLVAEEAGLDFLPVLSEDYDLCFKEANRDDPCLNALIVALRSVSFRRLLGELPGYDSANTGDLINVA